MSGRLVKEVFEHAPESLARLDLDVLLSLAESARDGDRQTRGGAAAADVIAYRVRSTPGSVRNSLGRLVARGLIVPLHAKARRGLAQQYRLVELKSWHRDT